MSNPKKEKEKTKIISPSGPFSLVILDGWGIYKDYPGNAIIQAQTPVYDQLLKEYPNTSLKAHGKYVGLPEGQDGNSEAGHMNLGAGRIVDQDAMIINKAIKSGYFFRNPAFKAAAAHVKGSKGSVHLMGLMTGIQSAHSDPGHLLALLKFFRQEKVKNVYLHLFTDGRDSFKYGAKEFLPELEKQLKPHEKIASITGRYYAMDRKKKWDRTEKVYDILVSGKSNDYAKSARDAIKQAYKNNETDEFIPPTVVVTEGKCDGKGICISGKPVATIKDGDAIVYFNLRSDRARQLTKTFTQKNFNKRNPGSFKRSKVLKDVIFVAMTDFGPDLEDVLSAFPSQDIVDTLPMALDGMPQLYISENEKFAHVTYFFNGGYADPVAGEERQMIPSVDVPTYDLKPQMSANKVTKEVLRALNRHDFITVNFANPDMVGHTGNLAASIKACEVVDKNLGRLYKKIKRLKGCMIVTSDHGNVEEMINQKTGEVDTQHSNFPVPFIIVDTREEKAAPFKLKTDKPNILKKYRYNLAETGVLGNVAPTILDLMEIEKPRAMSEKSLIIR